MRPGLLVVRGKGERGPGGRRRLVESGTGATGLGPMVRLRELAVAGGEGRIWGDGGCLGGAAVVVILQIGSRGGVDDDWG